MPKAQATCFDADLDERVNGAKSRELHAVGLTCHWLLLSPLELQALLDDVVPASVKVQAAKSLKPGPEEEQWFG